MIVDRPESVQSELRVGHIGIDRYDPRYFSAIIMSTVLGGMFGRASTAACARSSAIRTGAQRLRREAIGGCLHGGRGGADRCHRAGHRRAGRAARGRADPAVRRCRARRGAGLPGRHLPLRFESTGGIAAAIEPIAVYGLAEDFWQTYRDKIEAVTSAEAHNAAIELIRPDEPLILAVGDARVIRGDVEALGIAPVEVVPAP